jgi:trehalose 6-phosphate synthase/phosphatase
MARGIEAPGCGGHLVRLGVFPGGTDFETFEHITSQPEVKTRIDQLRNLFKDKLVILSRDRVDEVEGVPLKLHVIEKFFQKYPQWKGKVVYFQVSSLSL